MSGRFSEGTRHQLAHAGADGLLSAADYAKLASSTSNADPSSLVVRNGAGIALFNTEGWTAATLLNSFANFGGVYASAGYKVDIMGFVHLRGMVKRAAGAPAAGTIICTLGGAYVPAFDALFGVRTDTGQGELVVDTAGNVRWYAGGVAYIGLEGITFEVG
jgi:hypothetical protein